MVFGKPEVEFVNLEASVITYSSNDCPNPPSDLRGGSSETCTGYDAPSNSCKYNNEWWADNVQSSNKSKADASHKPKNVVGFDMTFDK